jgi:DNA-binding NarL/FixJ family response regulator
MQPHRQVIEPGVKQIRVLLIDDHALVRAGIRALLEKWEQVEVVGEAGDGNDALELIEKLAPDVVLLDLTMPGLSGFEVLKITTAQHPGIRTIVLTVHDEEEYAFQALRAGAAGYLPKSAASSELKLAIEHVMGGKKYLSPTVEQRAAFELGKNAPDGPVPLSELTPRQREVLTLIAEGHSTKDMARALNISVKTVETHRAQLMDRLGIHDIASLVRYAIKMGLVSIEERSPKKMGGGTNFILPLGTLLLVYPHLLPQLVRLFLS